MIDRPFDPSLLTETPSNFTEIFYATTLCHASSMSSITASLRADIKPNPPFGK